MRPARTSCAPYQSTPTTLAKIRKIATAVRIERDAVALRAASNASSAAAWKRARVARSAVKACMTRVAPIASVA